MKRTALRFKLAFAGGAFGAVVAILINVIIGQEAFVHWLVLGIGVLSGFEAGYRLGDFRTRPMDDSAMIGSKTSSDNVNIFLSCGMALAGIFCVVFIDRSVKIVLSTLFFLFGSAYLILKK